MRVRYFRNSSLKPRLKEEIVGRIDVVQYIDSVIKDAQTRQAELAGLKGDSDGPRTSHSLTIHLDIEMAQDQLADADYVRRCKLTLECLKKYSPAKVAGVGAIVTASVEGEEGIYILVEDGGGSVGPYQLISLKSPVGKAVAGRSSGEILTVMTPGGSLLVKVLNIA